MMSGRSTPRAYGLILIVALVVTAGACSKRQPPVARPSPPPLPPAESVPPPPAPPEPVSEPAPVPMEPIAEAGLDSRSLDELNRESPLQPVFFPFDSSEVDQQGRAVLNQNAEVLRNNPSWVVTIEGHCDERGTAEYNLALGERRALAARNYLVSLGIPPDRVRTVSYGSEFPFDPEHTESAWAKNRRAHFVITSR